jgi:hypothetical protein
MSVPAAISTASRRTACITVRPLLLNAVRCKLRKVRAGQRRHYSIPKQARFWTSHMNALENPTCPNLSCAFGVVTMLYFILCRGFHPFHHHWNHLSLIHTWFPKIVNPLTMVPTPRRKTKLSLAGLSLTEDTQNTTHSLTIDFQTILHFPPYSSLPIPVLLPLPVLVGHLLVRARRYRDWRL